MNKTARQAPLRSSSVFQKPTVLQRLWHLLEGFDGPLAFAVFLLACLGMLIMYSSGYDHGTRFVDHGRNMLIAGFIMFVVAQIPPSKLMAWAVPVYTVGVILLVAVSRSPPPPSTGTTVFGLSTLNFSCVYTDMKQI